MTNQQQTDNVPWMRALTTWSPTSQGAPHLYFTEVQLPDVRQRAETLAYAWTRLQDRAERALVPKSEPQKNLSHTIRHQARLAAVLALVGLVEQRADYQRRAWELLQPALEYDDWVNPAHKPLRVDLGYAGIAAQIAQAYDLLVPALEDTQREVLASALAQRLSLYHEIAAEQSEWWTTCGHNWQTVIHGEMGLVALAIRDRYPDVEEVLQLALAGVADVLDRPETAGRDGAYSEGVHYWGYGIGRAVWFADVLRQVTEDAVNLFEHPYLEKTGDFALHMATPDGNCFGFADCRQDETPDAMTLAVLAKVYRRSDYQWVAQGGFRMAGAPVWDEDFVFGRGQDLPGFLLPDPNLPAERPTAPTARHFSGMEVVAMRSGWEDDSTFLGLQAGKTTANHAHLDVGTFTLVGRGARLVGDADRWPYDSIFFDKTGPRWDYAANDTVGHNTVLVDGQGQVYGEGHEGRIERALLGTDVNAVVCDATAAYGGRLSRFVRYVVFLKPDVVVIVDDLAANDRSQFGWLLHTQGEVALKGTRWTIAQNRGALDVRMLGFDTLGREGGYTVGLVDRVTYYEERNDIPTACTNRYVAFETLHPVSTWLVPAVLRARDRVLEVPLEAELTRSGDQVAIEVSEASRTWRVKIDRADRTVHAVRLSE
jgi:hypothetical protein